MTVSQQTDGWFRCIITRRTRLWSTESVPFSRHFHFCNVLHVCNVRVIPTYRVYRLPRLDFSQKLFARQSLRYEAASHTLLKPGLCMLARSWANRSHPSTNSIVCWLSRCGLCMLDPCGRVHMRTRTACACMYIRTCMRYAWLMYVCYSSLLNSTWPTLLACQN